MKELLFNNPLFGIAISITCFYFGLKIKEKINNPLVNPLLISYALIITFLLIFNIPLSYYNKGGDIISLLLTPSACVLAITIYKQKALIIKHFFTIIVSSFVGIIINFVSIFFLAKLMGLEEVIMLSLIPKSITTPLAISLSSSINGLESLTVLAVIIAGTFGAIFSPLLIKIFKIKNPITQGIAIGSSSHVLGTSKAVELGEIQGSISSVSLTFTGLMTVVFISAIY